MPRRNALAMVDDILDDMPARGGARAGARGLRELTVMREVSVHNISRNPDQPRRSIDPVALGELKDSIRVHGLLTPINLWQLDEDSYLIVAGERRWTAFSEMAAEAPDAERNPDPSRYMAIPAMITDLRKVRDMAPHDAAFIRSTVENVQREDLNPSELAAAYAKLLGICHSAEAVAAMTGKSLRNITSYLAVNKVPAAALALDKGDVTLPEAEALARAKATDLQVVNAVKTLKDARGKKDAPSSAKARVSRALSGVPVVGPAPGPNGFQTISMDGNEVQQATVRPAALPMLSSIMRRAEVDRDQFARAIQEACELTNVWPKKASGKGKG